MSHDEDYGLGAEDSGELWRVSKGYSTEQWRMDLGKKAVQILGEYLGLRSRVRPQCCRRGALTPMGTPPWPCPLLAPMEKGMAGGS